MVPALLSSAYLLSDAPVVKEMGGTRASRTVNMVGALITTIVPICGRFLPIYKPADWLIDHTPLRAPLIAWAELWGVENVFYEATLWR